MRFIRNKNYSKSKGTIQVDAHIGTSYDTVRAVYEALDWLEPLAEAVGSGDLDGILQQEDIDALAKLNALILDANVGDRSEFATAAQGALADTAIQGPFASAGEATAGEDNTKAMTALRVAQAIEFQADPKQNNYTATTNPTVTDDSDAGYSVGSVWINQDIDEAFRCADAASGAAVWIKSSLTTDELAAVAITGNSDDLVEGIVNLLMTSAERSKLGGIEDNATRDQTGAEIKAAYEGEADTNAYTDAEKTKLAGVETAATADQTNAEITNAYNAEVAIATQVEMEAGTEPTVRRMTPEGVKQAITALGGGGGGGGGMSASYQDSSYTLADNELVYSEAGLQHFLPITPAADSKCSVWDCSDNAGSNAINIHGSANQIRKGDGTIDYDVNINMNGGRMDFYWTGSYWIYSYVVQTIQPDNVIKRTEVIKLLPGNGLEPVATFPATLVSKQYAGSNFCHARTYLFDSDWEAVCAWLNFPEGWVGNNLRLRMIWSPSNTNTDSCRWAFYLNPVAADGTVAISDVYINHYDTPSGVTDQVQTTPWTDWFTVPSADVTDKGIMFRLAKGPDSFTGNRNLISVEIEYEVEETLTAAITIDANAQSRTVAGTTDTLLLSDNGREVIYENAADIAVTLPDGMPEGWNCIVSYTNTGVPTVTPATDTVNGALTGVTPLDQWEGIHLHKYKAGAYIAKGTA